MGMAHTFVQIKRTRTTMSTLGIGNKTDEKDMVDAFTTMMSFILGSGKLERGKVRETTFTERASSIEGIGERTANMASVHYTPVMGQSIRDPSTMIKSMERASL